MPTLTELIVKLYSHIRQRVKRRFTVTWDVSQRVAYAVPFQAVRLGPRDSITLTYAIEMAAPVLRYMDESEFVEMMHSIVDSRAVDLYNKIEVQSA